ncbi:MULTISPECIES: right-handed parallel beta-helix repeat-containing protein [Halorussus]|uniref:right-handed parallel beta-helix repeat-containing protein n=1 Tax=Halorussus TaxID=1070314 RepID=UPI0020A1C4B2|nr:right-handed parallel beta-helix repeat-containing protein [Halorussus vallis]USZ74366.1 right-handed parallel beta-helix repeat-containing protein [Halorussus vallis]
MSRFGVAERRSNRLQTLTAVVVVLILSLAGVTVGGAIEDFDRGTYQQATSLDSCTVIDEPGTYQLTEPIENSTENTCIEIRASNVHFDGGGHTIDGSITRQELLDALRGPPPEAGVGVSVNPNGSSSLSNVTITNVTVTEWFRGVVARNSTRVTVRDITATTSGVGVEMSTATDSTVSNATAAENALFGIRTGDSHDSTVQDSTANRNGFNGVYAVNSRNSTVRRVTANSNGFSGIELTNSSESTVRNVTATENGFRGFGIVDEPIGNVVENVTVADNDFSRNGYAGIVLFAVTNSTFSNNNVVGTQGTLPPGRNPPVPSAGVIADGASGNVFTDTDARDQASWAYVAVNDATNTVQNFQTDAAAVTFEARDVALGPTTTVPSDAGNETTVTPVIEGVTVTNTSADAFIDLRIAWGSVESENQSATETAGR